MNFCFRYTVLLFSDEGVHAAVIGLAVPVSGEWSSSFCRDLVICDFGDFVISYFLNSKILTFILILSALHCTLILN